MDYKGNPILLTTEFTVLTDTESEEEGMADLEKPLLERVQATLAAKCDTEVEKNCRLNQKNDRRRRFTTRSYFILWLFDNKHDCNKKSVIRFHPLGSSFQR